MRERESERALCLNSDVDCDMSRQPEMNGGWDCSSGWWWRGIYRLCENGFCICFAIVRCLFSAVSIHHRQPVWCLLTLDYFDAYAYETQQLNIDYLPNIPICSSTLNNVFSSPRKTENIRPKSTAYTASPPPLPAHTGFLSILCTKSSSPFLPQFNCAVCSVCRHPKPKKNMFLSIHRRRLLTHTF